MWLPVVFFCAAGSCQFWTDAAYDKQEDCFVRLAEAVQVIDQELETESFGQCLPVKQRFTYALHF